MPGTVPEMAGKSMRPGGGGRFQALERKIESKGKSPQAAKAIAAAAGRAKYGAAGMARMAAAGRRRANRGV